MTENILGHMYRRLGEVEKAAAHYRISAEMRHSAVDGSDSLAIQDYSNYLFTVMSIGWVVIGTTI